MKTILHLCADSGSDSMPYKKAGYNVVLVGKEIGIENFDYDGPVHGVSQKFAYEFFKINQ